MKISIEKLSNVLIKEWKLARKLNVQDKGMEYILRGDYNYIYRRTLKGDVAVAGTRREPSTEHAILSNN